MRKPEDLNKNEIDIVYKDYNNLMSRHFTWPQDRWSKAYILCCNSCKRSVGSINAGRLDINSYTHVPPHSIHYYVWVLKKIIYPHLSTREHQNNELLERLGG